MCQLIASSLLSLMAAFGPGDHAVRFLEACRDGKYEEAVKPFDTTLAKVLPASKLGEVWAAIIQMHGPLKTIGPARLEQFGGVMVARVRLEFKNSVFDAIVSFNKNEDKIAGFNLAPVAEPGSEAAAPSYVDPSKFEEQEVTVGAEGWPLKGTLTRPKGVRSAPLVVLVHGSGPHDRNESIGPNAPFRDLAHGLGSRGVAVLRYEKRTHAYSQKVRELPKDALTIDSEVIDDALAAVVKGRTLPGVDSKRVILLGHSLGGSAAPYIAKRDGKLAGLILLAAADRQPDQILLDQFQYIAENDPLQAEGALKLRKELEDVFPRLRKGELKPEAVIMGAPIHYWNSWMALHPAKAAAELKGMPILVLRGGRDYQVTATDFEAFQAALKGRTSVVFHYYPKLNHLFHSGEGKGLPADYFKKGFVDARVIDDIAGWVESVK